MSNYPAKTIAKLTWLLPGAMIIAALLTFVVPAQAAPPIQTPVDTPSVAMGQSLWGENCMPCHGNGQGNGPTAASLPGPLPDMTNPQVARQYIPAENFDVIKNGRMDKMMPPWKNKLTDDQIWDAVAYVWSLSTSPQTLAAGAEIYSESCAACHGQDGSGRQDLAPINDFTDLAAMAQVSQADLFAAYVATADHAALSSTLTNDDIWASLDYARSFSLALPERNGILVGQVINPAGGKPVGNIQIALHAFQNNAKLETINATTDENGSYRFENLSTDHTVLYVVEGLYQDVGYISKEQAMFMPDSNETTLNLEVFNTTTSDENINITQLHYLLSFSPEAINVLQIFIVGNGGQQTFIGQDDRTFNFALPDNATNVVFQNDLNGSRFAQTKTGYADTEPVIPGEESLTISVLYDVPYKGDAATIELPLTADTAAMDVLMNLQGATLSSEQLEFIEDREFQGNRFSIFNGANYKAGQTISLQLTGLNDLEFATPGAEIDAPAVADTTWFNQEIAKWAVMGMGLVAVVVAAFVYPRIRPQWSPQPAQVGDETIETRRQRLLLTLARLDETYEKGELDETVYQRARARYKAELAQLMETE